MLQLAALLTLALGAATAQEPAPPPLTSDPDKAAVLVSDVALFWNAYDAWKAAGGQKEQLASILQSQYLDKASAGVADFTPNRIISAQALAERILDDPDYYLGTRRFAGQIAGFEAEIRKIYRKFQALYPEAKFPALYFVVGRRNSGGMSSPRALIIGAEMFGDEKARLRFDTMIPMVAHELMHYQQQTAPEQAGGFLGTCMREGAADFLAEYLVGRHINADIKSYGDSQERDLFQRFQEDLKKPNGHRAWLYNGGDKQRQGPPDLGYYIGYKITQSYYQAAADPQAALRVIIEMKDPQKLLSESRYASRFGIQTPERLQ